MFEGGEHRVNVFAAGIVAHETDADQAAFQRAEAAADLNLVFVQQAIANSEFIYALGQADGGQDGQFVAGLGQDVQAQRFDARSQGLAIELVTFPAGLQALFKRDAQGLAHGVDQVAARGMVIGVIAVPVAIEFVQVEIVALHGLFAVLDDLDGAFVERDGGQPWQRAQAFLAARIASVDLHVIDMHRHPTESADGVHYEERAMCVCNALKLLKRLPESGRGFCYGGGEKFRLWMFLEGLFEPFRGERLAQLGGEVDYFCACAFGDFHDLAAKEAQVARDKRIALFEQVGEDGFSAGETGAGDAERHLVLCLEYLAQQVRGLFQYSKKFWIDVAELRRGGDAQDTRVNVAWTRAKQQSVRGIDFGKCVLIKFALPHYQLSHAFPFLFAKR